VSAALLYGIAAAGLVALGLFGLVTQAAVLRKILAFNLLGGGVFLLFGVVAKRGGADPVPQAMVITGLVVAFAGTALAVAMALRMRQITGAVSIVDPTDRGSIEPTDGEGRDG
jgi:multicomponent Na+:H+ antiporter subunit C